MRRILRVMIAMLGPLGTLSALAQTPVPIPVTGNMGSISGGGTPYPGIDFQLQNCPAPITIPGYWGIIQTEYQAAADSSGVVNTTVWPNDLIDCNGTTGNSQYAVSYVLNGVTVSGPTCYQAVSTQGVWILNGPQQPISCTEPAPNPQDANFRNIYVSNLAQLNNVNITGTLNVSGAFSPPINIASGGTGATTANGAMLNLAGVVQSGTGTTQKDNFPGFVNGNVNGVFNVTTYGAVGDCVSSGSTAGCTNNTTAIQACVNAAYPVKGACSFPVNPAASGQTIYYMATAVNFKGVSLIGPPNGAGQINSTLSTLPVAIRGGAGQDMFAPGDPADGGYVTLDKDWHVRDLALLVDSTVDASASHPYRKPGKTCTDAAITTGTAVLTSASNQCVLEPGDVGQAIKVTGAGAAGADLTTTISACTLQYANKNNACTSVTLAANASTTVTGGTAYVSVMNLPVTATVGNCAFAFDQRVSQTTDYITHPEFRDVTLQVVGSVPNNTCGMFFQGNAAPYMGRWSNVQVGTFTYGYAFVPPSVGPIVGGQFLGLSDFNVFQHSWNEAVYPFISYGGNANHIEDWQLHSPLAMGVHILDGYNTGGGGTASVWTIDIGEDEGVCQSNSLTRIAGRGHDVGHFSFVQCATGTLQWDAQNTKVAALAADTGIINLTGSNNSIHSNYGLPTTINNSNVGNKYENGYQTNPFGGAIPEFGYGMLSSQVSLFASSLGVPGVSRGKTAFNRTHDFLDTGAANYYFNKEDLWLWPSELTGWTTILAVTPDSTSESGTVGTFSGTQDYDVLSANGVYMYVGKQVPAGLVRVTFKAKGNGAFNTTMHVDIDAQGGGATTICTTGSVAVTTAFALYSCDADLSAYAGKTFNPRFLAPGAGNSISFAWIGVRPWSTDTTTTNFKLGLTGTAMTGNQGTGLLVQHSTGALVSGNLLKADAAGNDIDAGFAASSVTTASSPTVGQAACIKAAGPPVVIGYCSTTVGAGGACTCN